MSTSIDVTGTVEAVEKEKTPKEETAWKSSLGHAVKSCMTVIRVRMGRYHKCKGIILSVSLWSAHIVSTFFSLQKSPGIPHSNFYWPQNAAEWRTKCQFLQVRV